MARDRDPGAHGGYVGAGSHLAGVLTAPGPFHVNGQFEGEIRSDDVVSVGRAGAFSGRVFARRVVVEGVLDGTIEADEVEIRGGGRIPKAEVRTGSLSLDPEGHADGARFLVRQDFRAKREPEEGG